MVCRELLFLLATKERLKSRYKKDHKHNIVKTKTTLNTNYLLPTNENPVPKTPSTQKQIQPQKLDQIRVIYNVQSRFHDR